MSKAEGETQLDVEVIEKTSNHSTKSRHDRRCYDLAAVFSSANLHG
jgi:hypothetical protein